MQNEVSLTPDSNFIEFRGREPGGTGATGENHERDGDAGRRRAKRCVPALGPERSTR